MTYEDIDFTVSERIATITLNRPERLNAASMRTHAELLAAFDAADRDDAVRTVIVTGAGRAFCAGTDLSNGFDLPTGGDPATGEGVPPDIGGTVTLRLFDMKKPVIAAINGVAAGFGATMLLAMDHRIAVNTVRLTFPFARRGIMAESCASWFLPRLVGISKALDWTLTGRMIEAQEALSSGLVNALVDPGDLMARARAMALDVAANTAPASVAVNRQLLWRMLGAEHPRVAHEYESRALVALLAHPDSKEGVASFVEKRPPAFCGTAADADFMKGWWPDLRSEA